MRFLLRFAGDSPPPRRKKPLSLASLNDRLMNNTEENDWEDRTGIGKEAFCLLRYYFFFTYS
jgi:hypothetical protein